MTVTEGPQTRERRLQRGAYGLSEDDEFFQRSIHEFAEREILPVAALHDERETFPHQTVAKMAELGLLGLIVPERYGGPGMSGFAYVLAMEQIAWADVTHSVIMSVNNSLVCEPILRFGTEEQRQRLLPPLAGGEYIGCYCLSEPACGSDAAALATTARKDGDYWVLNGAKSWITNGGEAGLYVVYARSNLDSARAHGITAFLIPADTQGLRVGAKERKLGIRASSTTQVFLEECRVPAASVLGEVDQGFRIAMATLDVGRIGIAAQALGIAQRALDEATAYAKQREAFGNPIANLQGIQWKLADMALKTEAARLLVYRVARMKDAGTPLSKEASMAKLFASEAAMFNAHEAVQIFGGNGFSREFPVERLFRDAKITEIYEGTSEIQRLVIAREILA